MGAFQLFWRSAGLQTRGRAERGRAREPGRTFRAVHAPSGPARCAAAGLETRVRRSNAASARPTPRRGSSALVERGPPCPRTRGARPPSCAGASRWTAGACARRRGGGPAAGRRRVRECVFSSTDALVAAVTAVARGRAALGGLQTRGRAERGRAASRAGATRDEPAASPDAAARCTRLETCATGQTFLRVTSSIRGPAPRRGAGTGFMSPPRATVGKGRPGRRAWRQRCRRLRRAGPRMMPPLVRQAHHRLLGIGGPISSSRCRRCAGNSDGSAAGRGPRSARR
jgi:hypothetical protein